MKVLITGGCGYIGSELCRSLSEDPKIEQVVIYDNLSSMNHNLFKFGKLSEGKFKFVYADILDSRNLRKALEGIDVVYHLAAKVSNQFETVDTHYYEQINHWGTAELVYAVEDSNVKKLIFLSSTAVYSGGADEKSEQDIPNPGSYYAISKLRAEEHVQRLFPKLETIIIRCGNVYGFSPSMKINGVINKFMFDAQFTGRIAIHGNGKQSRPFINIEKVAKSLHELANSKIESGIYNLTDKNISVLDLVDALKEIYPELEYLFINQHLTLKDIKVKRTEKLLKYIPFPETKLTDELREFKNSFAF